MGCGARRVHTRNIAYNIIVYYCILYIVRAPYNNIIRVGSGWLDPSRVRGRPAGGGRVGVPAATASSAPGHGGPGNSEYSGYQMFRRTHGVRHGRTGPRVQLVNRYRISVSDYYNKTALRGREANRENNNTS